MSKKNNTPAAGGSPVGTERQPLAESSSPAFVEDLLKNGTVILTAKTRDELAEMVNTIPAEVHYGAGAVCKNPETELFSLRIDITNS
jgi:hypothetical protein